MKKLIFKTFLLLTTISFISCEKEKDLVFNADGNEAAFFFASTNLSFPVSEEEFSLTVDVGVTNRKSADRAYNLVVNEEKTTAASNLYSIVDSSNLVIESNSFNGSFSIISNPDLLELGNTFTLVLDIVPVDGYAMPSKNQVTISIFKSCPLSTTSFTGGYLINELTPFVDGPTLDNGSVVQLTVINGSSLGRTFMTRNYPNYCSPLRAFNFDLICGEVKVRPDQPSTCQCTAAGLFFGPATTPSTFNPDDDSYFELTFTNDVTGNCSPAVQTTYSFTKQ